MLLIGIIVSVATIFLGGTLGMLIAGGPGAGAGVLIMAVLLVAAAWVAMEKIQ